MSEQLPLQLQIFQRKFNPLFTRHQRRALKVKKSMYPEWKLVLGRLGRLLEAGKRIRPYLCFLGYQAAKKGHRMQDLFSLAMALEYTHGFALVHDDIIDRSATRRNQETVHTWFTQLIKKRGVAHQEGHVGEAVGILAGDYLFAIATSLASSVRDDARGRSAKRFFEYMLLQLVEGQFKDVLASSNLLKVTEKQVIDIMRVKSGMYSVEHPLRLGIMLAGGSRRLQSSASKFAQPLGVGFQIQDDILGSFGNKQVLGKSTDSDIREGKATLLAVHALRHATKSERKFLISVLGNKKASARDISRVKQIFISAGSLAYAKQTALQFLQKARNALRQSTFSREIKTLLGGLADYLIQRTK
jgi:geranylgeranyl diphosphate synthase type I